MNHALKTGTIYNNKTIINYLSKCYNLYFLCFEGTNNLGGNFKNVVNEGLKESLKYH